MFTDLGDDVKRIFLAGVGAIAMTAERSSKLIDELVAKGELTFEQGKVLNEELKHNIKEKIKDTLNITATEGKSVMESLKDLSKEELAAIKAKIAELEKPDDENGDSSQPNK